MQISEISTGRIITTMLRIIIDRIIIIIYLDKITIHDFNSTLAEYLRHYVDKDLNTWDQLLPYALFVYNSTEHSSTNYQPYTLLYGKEINIPVNLRSNPEPRYNYDDYLYDLKQRMQESHKIARERLIKKKIKSKANYDSTAHSVELHVKDSI